MTADQLIRIIQSLHDPGEEVLMTAVTQHMDGSMALDFSVELSDQVAEELVEEADDIEYRRADPKMLVPHGQPPGTILSTLHGDYMLIGWEDGLPIYTTISKE